MLDLGFCVQDDDDDPISISTLDSKLLLSRR
jgi:hypothetical protein